ncbi:MAG: hypothetical protein VKK97_01475 [Synechococcaceae cyanobacterium]|nr:hypothetical protein [Synechococcaceae cyanobacterium]
MPDLAPAPFALGQPFRGSELSVFAGIELELFLPDGAECAPALLTAAQLEGPGIRQPLQQVADGVVGQKGIEVVRLQLFAPQLLQRHDGQLTERSAEGGLGGLIIGQVEAQGIAGTEEGRQSPVAPIALQPEAAAEHQLDQRFQRPGTALTGP